jgi:16S rRNA (guanine(966)-N(2))-methyltransferase RsmD
MKRSGLKCFDVPIVSGRYKGKKICIPDTPTTRSSKSILRESLFDTLQFEIVDVPFVEVFAGSGSIGLEALSRGASEGWFIEYNREVHSLLERNIAHLGVPNAHTIYGDSFERFPELLGRLDRPAYFYFDPPFSIRDGMGDIYDRTLQLIEAIDPDRCKGVIVEHMSTLDLPERIGRCLKRKSKRFGKSSLTYLAPA